MRTLRRTVSHIAELVKDKRVEGISDIRDESDRQGVRIVIEIKRDFQADVVLNQLYKYTSLQTSFGMNMLAINGGRASVKEIVQKANRVLRLELEGWMNWVQCGFVFHGCFPLLMIAAICGRLLFGKLRANSI